MLKLGCISATHCSALTRRMIYVDCSSESLPMSGAQPDTEQEVHRKRRVLLNHALSECRYRNKPLEVPTVVGGDLIYTNDAQKMVFPHNHGRQMAHVYFANRRQIEGAIKAALSTQGTWSLVPAEERLQIWREAANIIEQDAHCLIAHIVLGLGKTRKDAALDVRRLISALRSNADYMEHLSQLRFEIRGDMNVFPSFALRPMDGFVAAMAPFESVALSASLALCPALMGNTVLWHPALEIAPASFLVYNAFCRAGLPKGVLNFVPANENLFLETITDAVHFAGLNYHGSANKYRLICKQVGNKMHHYICFPRLAAECQGKNFHFVHSSADAECVAKASLEAAFNFAGQYSNSLSRLYVPASLWPKLRLLLEAGMDCLATGDPSEQRTNMGPVINAPAFRRLKALIDRVKSTYKLDYLRGGECDDTSGYYIQPTMAVIKDPLSQLLSEPISGPFLPVFVYADESLTDALKLAAHQTKYALSGSIFANRDEIVAYCLNHLRMSASNLYVNERCTGNPCGLTPFGGNRLSGTNDKCGSAYFLMRWSSPQLTEETIHSPIDN